jgi:hypothetical protein
MATLYERLNSSLMTKQSCQNPTATLLKNDVKLALVKVAEEYDFSIDIVEAILKDKKIITRFTLPNMKFPCNGLGCIAGLCDHHYPDLTYLRIADDTPAANSKKNFIDRCLLNDNSGLRGAGYENNCLLHLKRNLPQPWGYPNTYPSTKKQFIDYIKKDTSFKKNGGKYKDLNKMDKLQLLSFVVHSPLCD